MLKIKLKLLISFVVGVLSFSSFANVDILNTDKIKRAVLTNEIIQREPSDKIENTIYSNNEDIKTIYFFTQIINSANTKIDHVWFYKGDEQARVTLNIGSDSWRTYSSKKIQASQEGEWHLEIQNQEKETLAIARFNFIDGLKEETQ